MSLLQQAPQFSVDDAVRLARDLYGLKADASLLPSERDQNFLLRLAPGGDGGAYVLKIANATEDRAMLEAQNAAMARAAARGARCPRALPTVAGAMIAVAPETEHLVRLVTFLEGVPLAEVAKRPPALFEALGREVGRLDAALADFDHPAIHRDFHWDLARVRTVVADHLPRVRDDVYRDLIARISRTALEAIETRRHAFRRSAVHHDANDWNVIVAHDEGGSPTLGIIDFGDMVHSWTVADPAVAAAYAMLDAPDPIAVVDAVIGGYEREHRLSDQERASVFPLACLRLCMSACIAAWQLEQRPDDDYLAVSQEPIRRTLPAVIATFDGDV